MPVYFFDVVDNGRVDRDEFGVEMAGIDEARDQAVVLLPDMARHELPDGEVHVFACWVRDEHDRVVYKGTLTYKGERLQLRD